MGLILAISLAAVQEFRLGYSTEYLSYHHTGWRKDPGLRSPVATVTRNFSTVALHTDDPVVPTTGQIAGFKTQWYDAYPSPVSSLSIPTFLPVRGHSLSFSRSASTQYFYSSSAGPEQSYNSDPARIGLPVL